MLIPLAIETRPIKAAHKLHSGERREARGERLCLETYKTGNYMYTRAFNDLEHLLHRVTRTVRQCMVHGHISACSLLRLTKMHSVIILL